MATFTSQITILMLLLLSSITFHISMSSNYNLPRCNAKDRKALLTFKKGVIDRFDRLSNWRTEEDCCAWEGVYCNNISGRVTELHLNSQSLEGEINFGFLELEFLYYLDLSDNSFDVISSPPILHNITHASNLYHLDLSWNSDLHMDDFHWLSQLSSLTYLDLSGIDLHKHANWLHEVAMLPLLSDLYMRDCNLRNFLPNPSLKYVNFTSLVTLDLSYNNFNSELPSRFFNFTSLVTLDLYWSQIHGEIPSSLLNHRNLRDLYLSHNQLEGSIPDWIGQLDHLEKLDLSHNMLSGSIPSSLGISSGLYLSNNSLRGDISSVTLKASTIQLDHNNFTGRLPNLSPMAFSVDFSYNSFSGSIPRSWKNLKDLVSINLWSNRLFGNVLRHISDIKSLRVLNLGKNEFSGTIPINIPQNLQVIILRANHFEGNIPSQLFNLTSLFHLDLAHNKLNGSLPRCLYNMTQMVIAKDENYPDATIDLFTKGQDYLYNVDPQRRTIDLSANCLSGEVPLKLFQLIQVQTLNLSHNNFSGRIPDIIGGMINMESLDLSSNKFSGRIPQNLTLLHFLGYLNLSCNNLNGQIPIGTQLQSFNASSYIGNPGLCGEPLKKCFTEEENPENAKSSSRHHDSDPFRESLYLGMGVGFAAGFWGICGSLFLIRKWRHAFFQFFDQVTNKLYVAFMVKLNSFGKTRPPAS